jgi:hypothetical protein
MSFVASRRRRREPIDEFYRFVFKGTCLARRLSRAKKIAAIRKVVAVGRRGSEFRVTPGFPLARRLHRYRHFRL